MTEYKSFKVYLQKNSIKLKESTSKQKAFSAFIEDLNKKGLKGIDFREARENFLSSN